MALPYRLILVACPPGDAPRIADGLLERRLAACVSAVENVSSRYWWEGRIESGRETLLLIKAPAGRFEEIREAIGALHPYDTPEILSFAVEEGAERYLRWIDAVTAPPASPRRRPGE